VVRPPKDQVDRPRPGLFYFVRPGDDVDIAPAPSPLLRRLGVLREDEVRSKVTGLQYVRERVRITMTIRIMRIARERCSRLMISKSRMKLRRPRTRERGVGKQDK